MRLVLSLAFLIPCSLSAQQRTVTLGASNAKLQQEFSDLSTLRELADGRVLLFDRKEERLMVADFATGTVRDVARKGQGPAEFQYVSVLLPLKGDSTIAADMDRRWLILVGDSVVRKLLPEHPALQRIALAPLGAGNGRVLSRVFGGSPGSSPDSTPITLVDRASGNAETIARMANSGRRGPVTTGTTQGGRALQIRRVPLQTSEQPLLFSDGWVAVVRIDPYRVDWRSPDGRWTLGRPLPIRTVRLTATEKAAYLKRKPGLSNATDWPFEMPPFETPVTVLEATDGLLLVRRLPTLGEPGTRYDVIDRSGNRRTQLVLAGNEYILGFGAKWVYVVETDNDGIQRLRRHALYTSLRP